MIAHRSLTFLILIAGWIIPHASCLLASPNNNAPNINGSRGTTTPRTLEFAPNGVCINPSYFADGEKVFTMRNVPGEGDCMFLAVALAAATSLGLGGNDVLLQAISRETRAVVAQVLNSPTGNLHIEGDRIVPARTLLQSAAKQEGLSPDEYLERLLKEGRNGGLYGGGPELTVLSNILRRPISIYEVPKNSKKNQKVDELFVTNPDGTVTCPIKCMGVFGDPVFADPCAQIPNSAVLSGIQPGAYSWHLHILVLNVSNGEKHACVLLPQSPTTANPPGR